MTNSWRFLWGASRWLVRLGAMSASGDGRGLVAVARSSRAQRSEVFVGYESATAN